jgi:hypothetical protein
MRQSQRAAHNPALEHAVKLANERDQAVVVGFGLYERYPDAVIRELRVDRRILGGSREL